MVCVCTCQFESLVYGAFVHVEGGLVACIVCVCVCVCVRVRKVLAVTWQGGAARGLLIIVGGAVRVLLSVTESETDRQRERD